MGKRVLLLVANPVPESRLFVLHFNYTCFAIRAKFEILVAWLTDAFILTLLCGVRVL